MARLEEGLHGHARTSGVGRRQAAPRGASGKVLSHRFLAEGIGLALDDADRVLRALAEAGPQAVAVGLGREPGLAVADFDRALGAGRHALSATVTLFFVDFDDFTLGHDGMLSLGSFY